MRVVHLDTDFLVRAMGTPGPERRKMLTLLDTSAEIKMSAVAWYEFARGPRPLQQLVAARTFLLDEGVIPFSEELAERAAALFRGRGSPRRRAADLAIAATALAEHATLLTCNLADFQDIPDLMLESA